MKKSNISICAPPKRHDFCSSRIICPNFMAAVVCEGGEELCVHSCVRVFRVYAYICACKRDIVRTNGMAAVRERARARARGAPFQTWKCAGNRATSKKNAELLPRGNRYLQTDQHVLSDHGRVLNSLK
jgi:hypothetical protein